MHITKIQYIIYINIDIHLLLHLLNALDDVEARGRYLFGSCALH